MKVVLLTVSGHAYAEEASPYYRWIQLDDGDHLCDRKSVMPDVEHKQESLMIAQQGVSSEEGDTILSAAVHESDRVKLHGAKLSRDKMFIRRLSALGWNIFYVAAVLCMSMTIYVLLWVFMWAGFHIWLPL